MIKHEFSSVFADEIKHYIEEKVNSGYKEISYKSHLSIFDQFCEEQKISEIIFTKEYASKWMKRRESESNKTYYSRINASKLFLEYLSLKGYDVYVFDDVKFKTTDFIPHIYTDDEVTRYFKAVDEYSSIKNRKASLQFPVLFRIMYCCGTRINETLNIQKQDIDLEKGIIKLRETKNGTERYIVLKDDLLKLLNIFADRCFYMLNDDDYIFTNANNGRLSCDTVYRCHREFLNTANIPYIGDGNGPRLHDWRHHMAVYSFKQLIDLGYDMYVALPILSTYLGHKTIYATEKYIRLTFHIFPYIENKFRDLAAAIFKGSDSDEEH